MPQPSSSLIDPGAPPFVTFRFVVEVQVDGVSDRIAGATFSEVDGLEMTMEPKTLREGGRNTGPVQLAGGVSYGQLTLKRGMTPNFDLWKWFERVSSPGYRGVRASAEVVLLSADGQTENARFVLQNCLPVKLRAPTLNALTGQVAIEEMQLVYEALALKDASGQPLGSAPAAGGGA